MHYQCLKFECLNGVGVLTLQRPKALNALNSQLLLELKHLMAGLHRRLAGAEIKQSPSQTADKKEGRLLVLIIRGEGERAFAAGADIKEMLSFNSEQAEAFAKQGQEVFSLIETLPIPVIAVVFGFALGGGLELALACDIILMGEKAKAGLPETSLGLLPAFGGTQRLARAVGLYKAKEMIFSGRVYSAKQAFTFGLAGQIYPNSALMTAAFKLADDIKKKGPQAVSASKKLIHQLEYQTLPARLNQEAKAFGELFNSSSAKEGLTAFIEKRPPRF